MECKNHIAYDIDKSSRRMDGILYASDSRFRDESTLPSRENLTFDNGYYVNVTALFVDIVDSSSLPEKHRRPVLAKIYRCFLSEVTAILNSEILCKEISIYGDCVWGVFETPCKKDIDCVFDVAAKVNSLIKIFNYKLRKKGYEQIEVGIGLDYGRALMIKAGYSGSGLNDVVWMGDVVNNACHLANKAGRDAFDTIILSSVIFSNLCDKYKNMVIENYIGLDKIYQSNVVNIGMENWYKKNCNS